MAEAADTAHGDKMIRLSSPLCVHMLAKHGNLMYYIKKLHMQLILIYKIGGVMTWAIGVVTVMSFRCFS